MTARFTPDPGTLFYADAVFTREREVGFGSTATVIREKDRSYNTNVLRCVAVDSRVVIGESVWGFPFSEPRRMLVRADYTFQPVGPEVAQALGLAEQAKEG